MRPQQSYTVGMYCCKLSDYWLPRTLQVHIHVRPPWLPLTPPCTDARKSMLMHKATVHERCHRHNLDTTTSNVSRRPQEVVGSGDKATLQAIGPKPTTAYGKVSDVGAVDAVARFYVHRSTHRPFFVHRSTHRPLARHCTFRDILLKRTTSAVRTTSAILLSAKPSPAPPQNRMCTSQH